jgi:hypothetical protein
MAVYEARQGAKDLRPIRAQARAIAQKSYVSKNSLDRAKPSTRDTRLRCLCADDRQFAPLCWRRWFLG